MTTYNLPGPEPMVCTGDVVTNWKQFREAFDDYSIATQLAKKSAEIQAATLKTIMGKECRQILSYLQLTDDEKKSTKDILNKLEAYFAPTRNILYELYIFHMAVQQPNETADQYLLRLHI